MFFLKQPLIALEADAAKAVVDAPIIIAKLAFLQTLLNFNASVLPHRSVLPCFLQPARQEVMHLLGHHYLLVSLLLVHYDFILIVQDAQVQLRQVLSVAD